MGEAMHVCRQEIYGNSLYLPLNCAVNLKLLFKKKSLEKVTTYMTKTEKYVTNHEDKGRFWDFPGGTVVKNPPANAGDTGSSPGPGRSHMPRSN